MCGSGRQINEVKCAKESMFVPHPEGNFAFEALPRYRPVYRMRGQSFTGKQNNPHDLEVGFLEQCRGRYLFE